MTGPEATVLHGPAPQVDAAPRRVAVRRGLAAGGAVLAAGLAGGLRDVRPALAAERGDAAVLHDAIGLERTAAAAYDAAAASGLLEPGLQRVAERFGRHEREHAAALVVALAALGGSPPEGVDDRRLEPLRGARSREDVLAFAVELETMALAAYREAQRRLTDPRLLMTGAQIMANQGQHLVVLRQALRRDPLPNAFETGRASR